MSASSPTRALVAGACGGIGRATVRRLSDDGVRVVGVDRTEQSVNGAEATLACDLRDGTACVEAVTSAARHLDGLDLLVHAAGVARDGVLWKIDTESWRETLEVNLESAFHLCRAAIPHLRSAGGGAIVLVSSINGERGKFGQTAYAASKAGLNGLARSLARETGRFDIRVNVVAPGMIRTPMTESLPPAAIVAAEEESCLGRIGEPADVASAIAFLAGPGARHITGQVLRVDGGQYL
jgi:acetoacetyl-CoA reductase